MRYWFPALLFLLAFAALPAAGQGQATTPANTLFVGNSFTYYNNSLHHHYRQMLREAEPARRFRTRSMTISGARLEEHAGLEALLARQDWDVVVMQGHSLEAIEDFDGFKKAAGRHAKAIRAAGAEPVLFMTWAYSGRPEMTADIQAGYETLGDALDALVVPVGLAFAEVTRERPGLALRTADLKHPTLAGTYLAASVFFAALQQRPSSPLGYDAGLPADDAAYLRRVADEVVLRYLSERAGGED